MKCFLPLLILSFLLINKIHAQEVCKVDVLSLQGKYSGDCKKGKAEGEGKASGKDQYEGAFKNGLPDGYGVYSWANKEVYKGYFKKAERDGKGEMKYITKAGEDSVVTGYWKKDKYIGTYEKPYQVNGRTSKISRVDFSLSRNTQKQGGISINTMMLSGAAAPDITDITVVSGDYGTQSNTGSGKSTNTRLFQVAFPFRARFTYSNGEMVDISFNEVSEYEITVNIL